MTDPKGRKGAAKRATAREKKPVSVLRGLAADEARIVLWKLLDLHPGLQADAEALARALLRDRSCEAIADDVVATLSGLEDDELYQRSGAQSWGYVDSGEAAYEIADDAVKSFLDEIARCVRLELEEEALESLKGLLLGLYRSRDVHNATLEELPDFLPECASRAVEVWRVTAER